ncbi:hypothetical protein [Nonlabens sp. YIK11]|uniref:hypothetical protein n=1 Tax=Nonlabens sp. YIK11 TaxID=1453349 RepID=UPI000A992C61|nr:hypothetical protein [Nonlabens sp. YIK11]
MAATHIAMAAFDPAQLEYLLMLVLFLVGSGIAVGLEIDRFRESELNQIIISKLDTAYLEIHRLQQRDHLQQQHLKDYGSLLLRWNQVVSEDSKSLPKMYRDSLKIVIENVQMFIRLFTYLSNN